MTDGRALPAWANALHGLIVENLAGLGTVADQIGDELINVVPPLPQANSGYGILYHCTQVVLFWAGTVIGGERIPRDRATEFTATGSVADLHTALDDVAARLPAWVEVAATDGVRDRTAAGSRAATATPEYLLGHLVRELAQHLGQLEITRDVLATGP
ncbi:mycothiol transferase [Williamsia muralis]|uniref:mycothiol transferase n=1 Tax=Williamsia marianensis TaxID=85044 RepID=UPI0037F6BB6A